MVSMQVGRQKAPPIEDSEVPAVLEQALQLEESDKKEEAAAMLEDLVKRLTNKQKEFKKDAYGRLTGLYEAIYQAIQESERQSEEQDLDEAA